MGIFERMIKDIENHMAIRDVADKYKVSEYKIRKMIADARKLHENKIVEDEYEDDLAEYEGRCQAIAKAFATSRQKLRSKVWHDDKLYAPYVTMLKHAEENYWFDIQEEAITDSDKAERLLENV